MAVTAAPAGVRCIRAAWIAALLTGSMTTAVTLGASLGTNGIDYVPWMWLDVVLIAGLGWGLYRRSRVAAALMLVYFAAAKVLAVRRDLQQLDDPAWADALESLDTCIAGGLGGRPGIHRRVFPGALWDGGVPAAAQADGNAR